MSGAIGEIQLKKAKKMLNIRLENSKYFVSKFKNSPVVIIQNECGKSSWFAFSLLLKGHLKNKRKKVISLLDKLGIETRPVVVGNFMKNPVIKYFKYINNKNYFNSDYVDKNGFYVGNYPKILSHKLIFFIKLYTISNKIR